MHGYENGNHVNGRILSLQDNLFKLALVTFSAVSLVDFGDTTGKLLTS
jgi:hypothetical protein